MSNDVVTAAVIKQLPTEKKKTPVERRGIC